MALPAEISNLIFDECISDKALLATWGLVSKNHLVASRFHLFSAVRLDNLNAHGFAEILDAPSCDISHLLQRLTLSSRSLGRASEWSWFPYVVPRLPAFPNLTTLCLHNSKFVLTEDARIHLHSILPAVTTLEIVNFPFAYPMAAIEFACGFPALEALTFFPKPSLPTLALGSGSGPQARMPGSLRTLALRCSVDEQPNWLLVALGQAHAPALTSLRVREAGARDFPVLARALARQGASLESLALDFADTIVEVAFLRNYLLEGNRSLRRLELALGSNEMVELCVLVLSHITSPVLQEVVFDIWIDPKKFRRHPWERLDAAIVQGPSAMRSVELRVGTLIRWAPLARAIRKRMSMCDELGILRIRIDDEDEC
ncbi:hypothetical protein B0H16DRAFT_1881795 [Mycena metata]|uniref:F-box domain-containing protein n=1 Tax=Mycena metata TaxID=1033252 RepID=A0AAD7JQW7_9AGAR|nr:hypothetical protein B0H16DRAFT_1881795 [Mycena metata]